MNSVKISLSTLSEEKRVGLFGFFLGGWGGVGVVGFFVCLFVCFDLFCFVCCFVCFVLFFVVLFCFVLFFVWFCPECTEISR